LTATACSMSIFLLRAIFNNTDTATLHKMLIIK
jgi:hypothetical protein